jgi:predicted HTH transcriptional regulator
VTIEDLNNEVEFRDRNYLNPEIKEMFHALGLIESYGSGIRRAKHAMAYSGNPPLLFEPLNDTDDYTMVTCPINEEFAYIRDHEDEATRKTSEKTTANAQETSQNAQETTANAQETSQNAQEVDTRILRAISEDPTIGARKLSELLGVSYDTTRYWLRKLRSEKVIHHEGPTKSGYWVIDKEQHDG